MKIEKIEKSKEKVIFILEGEDNCFINTLRRSIQEIPILAIDEVEFYKNDSALNDEVIAHRMGLIPLKADKTYTLREECSCKNKGCLKCTSSFKLKAKGPCTVYSSQIKTKGFEIVYNMPIVILEKDQELELSGTATLGKAKDHAKYLCGLAWFRAFPNITIRKCDGCGKCISVCPKKAIREQGKKIEIDPMKCDICNACIELCKKENKEETIIIEPSEKKFIFTIESFGQLKPEEIFLESLEALNKNLKSFEKQFKSKID